VFVAEGVLAYLDEAQVHRLLDALTRLAAGTGVLLADIPGRSLLDAPFMAGWLARLDKAGMSWRFGTDEPEALLAAHGWDAHVTEYGDPEASYGRWPFPRADRHDLRWPHSYLITARPPAS
jgi:O-methyltransferase involved in polyketide biosynthesis